MHEEKNTERKQTATSSAQYRRKITNTKMSGITKTSIKFH